MRKSSWLLSVVLWRKLGLSHRDTALIIISPGGRVVSVPIPQIRDAEKIENPEHHRHSRQDGTSCKYSGLYVVTLQVAKVGRTVTVHHTIIDSSSRQKHACSYKKCDPAR